MTADEKESMSDDEVEKWETKIKDSLLRNDGTLSSVVSSMKNSMLAGITIDGKTYNLSDFGISTGSYFSTSTNEKMCIRDSYQTTLNTEVQNSVNRINELGQTIFALNKQIQGIESGSGEYANDLRDQRDNALDELSGLSLIHI